MKAIIVLPTYNEKDNIEKIKSMLDLLVAESYLLGMTKEEFIDYSTNLFANYGVMDDE